MARDNEPGMPKPKGKTSGSGKWTKYAPQAPKTTIDWGEISAPLIGELVQEVTASGAALLLGTTRDGGALVITVCDGDQRIKFYATSPEELSTHATNIIAMAKS